MILNQKQTTNKNLLKNPNKIPNNCKKIILKILKYKLNQYNKFKILKMN